MKAALAFIEPLIPTLVEQPPIGDGWLHEIKHEGMLRHASLTELS